MLRQTEYALGAASTPGRLFAGNPGVVRPTCQPIGIGLRIWLVLWMTFCVFCVSAKDNPSNGNPEGPVAVVHPVDKNGHTFEWNGANHDLESLESALAKAKIKKLVVASDVVPLTIAHIIAMLGIGERIGVEVAYEQHGQKGNAKLIRRDRGESNADANEIDEFSMMMLWDVCARDWSARSPDRGDDKMVYCKCIEAEVVSDWRENGSEVFRSGMFDRLERNGVVAACVKASDDDRFRRQLKGSLKELALKVGMPTGFLGVDLQSSLAELKEIRPDVKPEEDGWGESAILDGERFSVRYNFGKYSDVEFTSINVIVLARTSSLDAYLDKQGRLEGEFGSMSDPARSEDALLHSERFAGGFVLTHQLHATPNDEFVELVLLHFEGSRSTEHQ